MSGIGGKKRENTGSSDYSKKVGLFEANVIAINPSPEEYAEMLGIEVKEDSKATEYLGRSQDDNITLRIDIWLEEIKNKDKFKVTFFLEDKQRENKDGTKKQYINNIGMCSWASDVNNLPDWFKKRDYRVAYTGEEDLYNFLRTWLGSIDYSDMESTLQLDWNKLMKGNVRDLKLQINGEWSTPVVALATVKFVVKEDETKEYQNVYTKAFLPAYELKKFRLVDYSNSAVINTLRSKKSKDLKTHERFVLNVTGEYGCKDFYKLKDIEDYDPNDSFVASNEVLSDDGGDY
jgi:hypothetical protein